MFKDTETLVWAVKGEGRYKAVLLDPDEPREVVQCIADAWSDNTQATHTVVRVRISEVSDER